MSVAHKPEVLLAGLLGVSGVGLIYLFELAATGLLLILLGVVSYMMLRPPVHPMEGYGVLSEGMAVRCVQRARPVCGGAASCRRSCRASGQRCQRARPSPPPPPPSCACRQNDCQPAVQGKSGQSALRQPRKPPSPFGASVRHLEGGAVAMA